MSLPTLSLVIPLYNEQANVETLVERIRTSGLLESGLKELILVENGSQDHTNELVKELAAKHPWIVPVFLNPNQGYGGGVYQGLIKATGSYAGYICGDLQISPEDTLKVWQTLTRFISETGNQEVVGKGVRTLRLDGWSMKITSFVYTRLANRLLNLSIRDLNGLPKIFPASLLQHIPKARLKTFTFDAQLLSLASRRGIPVIEVPVCFYARRKGVSSWSQKRLQIYRQTIMDLLFLRHQATVLPEGIGDKH